MKIKKKVKWIKGEVKKCKLKTPKGYVLVSVDFHYKKYKHFNGYYDEKEIYTRVTTYWKRE